MPGFVSGCGPKDVPMSNNFPNAVSEYNVGGSTSANRNLAVLLKKYPSAVITPAPWIGYWWPYISDGIADSAAKYDAVTASKAKDWEKEHHGAHVRDLEDWWGHCNGWAAAAILMPEPKTPLEIAGVKFEIADRKALFTESHMEVTGDFLGTRVYDPDDTTSEAFEDVWPAQMFLGLTNVMGAGKKSLIIDRYTGAQVWNQPLVAYFTRAPKGEDDLGRDPDYPNIYRINLSTTLWWASDSVDPNLITPTFNPSNPSSLFSSRTLNYELWLDAPPKFNSAGELVSSGNIILSTQNGHTTGGIWKNTAIPILESHPDYMWTAYKALPSSGYKNPQINDKWIQDHLR